MKERKLLRNCETVGGCQTENNLIFLHSNSFYLCTEPWETRELGTWLFLVVYRAFQKSSTLEPGSGKQMALLSRSRYHLIWWIKQEVGERSLTFKDFCLLFQVLLVLRPSQRDWVLCYCLPLTFLALPRYGLQLMYLVCVIK